VAHGTLTLGGTSGLTFTAGSNGSASMTFSGTLADLNTALAGLAYQPTANFNGGDTLTITTNDQGNTGAGGALSDTDTVAITVGAVNDAPLNSVPTAQSTNEDTTLVFSTANGNPISLGDVDAGSGELAVTLSVAHGTLTLGGTSGLTFTAGSNGSASMTFSGTLADLNTALAGLAYQPTANFNGGRHAHDHDQRPGEHGRGWRPLGYRHRRHHRGRRERRAAQQRADGQVDQRGHHARLLDRQRQPDLAGRRGCRQW
jgi:hypothetical protein